MLTSDFYNYDTCLYYDICLKGPSLVTTYERWTLINCETCLRGACTGCFHALCLALASPSPPIREQCKVCLLVACLTSQQHASVSQGRICTDNFTCCHTEIELADPTFYLTQSQYTDAGPTSPRADPITPGAWQGSHWSVNFEVTGMTRPRKYPGASGIRTRDIPLSRRTP